MTLGWRVDGAVFEMELETPRAHRRPRLGFVVSAGPTVGDGPCDEDDVFAILTRLLCRCDQPELGVDLLFRDCLEEHDLENRPCR